MPKFVVHVALRDPNGYDVSQFAPGDVLPDWAVGLVGDHCLDSAEVAEERVEATEEEPEEVAEKPAPKRRAKAAPAEGLDFTKPAPRRGRAPKGE